MDKLIFQTPDKDIRIDSCDFKGVYPVKNDVIVLYGFRYKVRERIFVPLSSELYFVLEPITQ